MRARCDLLKIHYLCGRNDNGRGGVPTHRSVVICSKFITFVVEMTTFGLSGLAKVVVVICSKFITFVVEMTTGRYVDDFYVVL